jgi:hypothetical protein
MARKAAKLISVDSETSPIIRAGTASLAMIVIAIALFAATRLYILFYLKPQISDMREYFIYASKAIDLHKTPYQDDFEIEYPPVAWWTVRTPRLLDERRFTNFDEGWQVSPILIDYTRSFRNQMFVFDLASLAILLFIVWKRRPQLAGWAMLMYTITTAIFAHLLYDRLDVGLLLLMMLWAYCWMRSLKDSGRPIAWTAAAYAMLGLSISYKVIPIICVPFLLLAEFHAPRRATRLTYALLALVGAISIPFVIQYAISGPGVFFLFMHHAEREIQLESLYSTLMMIASLFGKPVFVSHSHGAFNLSGDLSNSMKILSVILMFGFLAGEGLWALLRWSRYSRQNAYRLTCYVIPAAVIFSNVLSPQYFIWAFPLLLLLAVEILPPGQVSTWTLGVLLLAVAAMSTWIFPYHYFTVPSDLNGLIPMQKSDLLAPSPVAYIVLGLRNFTYLGVVLWMGVLLYKRIDQVPIS